VLTDGLSKLDRSRQLGPEKPGGRLHPCLDEPASAVLYHSHRGTKVRRVEPELAAAALDRYGRPLPTGTTNRALDAYQAAVRVGLSSPGGKDAVRWLKAVS
jgi:hypothetical protein